MTMWLWEGVVPYLRPDEVERTLDAISARSAPGSSIAVQYQARSLLASAGRRVSDVVARFTGFDNALRGEPWRSLWTPASMAALLDRHRFVTARDDEILAIAQRIGSPVMHRRSLSNGRIAVATFGSRASTPAP